MLWEDPLRRKILGLRKVGLVVLEDFIELI